MVKIITADKEIAHLQNQFKKNLRLFMEQTIYCKMGFSGGYVEDKVNYSPRLNIWVCSLDGRGKFWNAFGIGKPEARSNVSITGEINFLHNS